MITIKTLQQPKTQESTGKCIVSGSAQSTPLCMTGDDINVAVRGQRRGHRKGVGRQLTRVPSPSSTAAGSSTSVLQSYHQYLQSYISSVYSGFQLPPMPLALPFMPPQQGQPDDEHTDVDAAGPTNFGDSQDFFFYDLYVFFPYIYILFENFIINKIY